MFTKARRHSATCIAMLLLAAGCEPGHLGAPSIGTGRGPTGGGDELPPTVRLMDGSAGDPAPGTDGGPAPPPARDAGPSEPPPPPPPPMATPYPTGPYGFARGRTMGDLSFTGSDGARVTLGGIRADVSVKVIVWISSVEWCGSCRAAVPELVAIQNRYASQGMLMIESLYEDYEYSPATTATAQRWARELDTNYPIVVEPNPAYTSHANPASWVIDAETMQILDYTEGSDGSLGSTIAEALANSSR